MFGKRTGSPGVATAPPPPQPAPMPEPAVAFDQAAASPQPEIPAGTIDESQESEGTDIEESEELVTESEPHMEHGPMAPVDEVDHRLVRNPRTGEVIRPPEDL